MAHYLLYEILSIPLSIGITWYYLKSRWQVEQAQLKLTNKTLQNSLEEMTIGIENLREKNISLLQTEASLRNENQNLLEKLDTQKNEMVNLQEKLKIEFRNLSNQLLEEKSTKFTKQNKEQLENVLDPLKEKLIGFEKTIEQTNKESIERNASLRTEINKLSELNVQVTKEAENLTKAIQGDVKAQGEWGEVILEKILEISGLVKDREYFLQNSFSTEEGTRYRPDVIIKLPDQKNIVIDSKVSITHYKKFFEMMEEEEKNLYLKKYIQSVRTHIQKLGQKNYQAHYTTQGLDFVLMFIPIESAFSLAIQKEHNLINEAYQQNVLVTSPTTLIATLRTIACIWKTTYQNQNALEIAKKSGELYDKFVGFVDDLKNIGKQMDISQRVYTEAVKKLYQGRGNLVRRTEDIKKLGANTTKSLDQKLLDYAYQDLQDN